MVLTNTEHTPSNSVAQLTCPACGEWTGTPFFTLEGVPAICTAVWKSETEAKQCKTGNVRLNLCHSCGLVSNPCLDTKLDYDENYENSLDFSPAFQAYAQALAERLRYKYNLRNRRIVEIGSGRGEFLKLLTADGENDCVGYDPAFDGAGTEWHGVRFVQDYYGERYASEPVDFVTCRHVLEHMEEPLRFLTDLRRTLAAHGEVVVYFEVPNAFLVFAGQTMWDVIYQHVQYFTSDSLSGLFQRAGFQVIERGVSFQNQFLYVEARVRPDVRKIVPHTHSRLGPLIATFAERFNKAVSKWSAYLREARAEGNRIAFWGGGSKGVTFLNVVPGARQIEHVIDINPRKQGTYLPGTGQRVSAPEELVRNPPVSVVTLNPAYVREIASTLTALGVRAEILTDLEQKEINRLTPVHLSHWMTASM
jgi:SAM-dependent methyltransferase